MTSPGVPTAELPVATTPWPHQVDAFTKALAHDGFLVAIPMGGGKGLVAVAIAEHHHAQCTLVVCPRSVVGVWPTQFADHALRDYVVFDGTVHGARGPLRNPSVARRAEALLKAHAGAIRLNRPFVAIVNFEAVWQSDMAQLTLGLPIDQLIADESHRVKSPGGKASKHLAKLGARVRSRGGRVLNLTGTPMPHSPLDIWAQLRTLDGGHRLGTSYSRFCHQYGAPEQIYAAGGIQRTVFKDVREDALQEFTDLIAPVMYQMGQDELDRMLGLPDTVDIYRTCDLQPATRRLYDELEKDLIAEVDGGVVTAANAMVLVLRLAQVTSGCAPVQRTGPLTQITQDPDVVSDVLDIDDHRPLVDPPEKAALLADVLEDLDTREPVVVFARFRADLDAIQHVAESQGRRYAELSGRRRDGLTPQSTMNPNIDVLGCQLRSGGVGVDFTRARYAIYFSLDFSLADHDQSRKRLHRPGQTRRTTYIHLLANDTVDQAVYGALRRRKQVINAVIDRMKGTP